MGACALKHVEWPYRNKTCTVLHQVGVSFDLDVLCCGVSCLVVLCCVFAVFSRHVALFCVRYLCYAVNVIHQLPMRQNLPQTPSSRSPSRPPKSATPKPQVDLLNSTLYPYIKIFNKNMWTLSKIKKNLVRDYETPCRTEWNTPVICYGPCWYKKTFYKVIRTSWSLKLKKKIILCLFLLYSHLSVFR